ATALLGRSVGGIEVGEGMDGRRAAYIDNEQGSYFASKTLKNIMAVTGGRGRDRLDYFDWRAYSWQERRALLAGLAESGKYGLIVVDGAREMVPRINIEEEATAYVSELMKISTEKDLHVINVLHQNKNDNNARGHLGTELMNKSETVIEVAPDGKNKAY